MTLEQVRAWRPADVDAQVDVLTRARNRLLDCDDELTGAAPPSSWAGGAADAAAV
ncbi:MAG: alpha/beta hydrolase, partial [Dietzia sp.]|nr:alpha/beta hydrolase [Dietzia sp.]